MTFNPNVAVKPINTPSKREREEPISVSKRKEQRITETFSATAEGFAKLPTRDSSNLIVSSECSFSLVDRFLMEVEESLKLPCSKNAIQKLLKEYYLALDPNTIIPNGELKGASVAWLAAFVGDMSLIKLWSIDKLLDNINAFPNSGDHANKSILYLILKRAEYDLARDLIKKYKDLDISSKPTKGLYAEGGILYLLADAGKKEIIRDLIQQCPAQLNFNAAIEDGSTPALCLAFWKEWDFLEEIRQQGFSINFNAMERVGNLVGHTIFWLAAKNKRHDLISKWIDQDKERIINVHSTPASAANVDEEKFVGVNVIHLLAKNRHLDVARRLVTRYKNVDINNENEGKSALWYAVDYEDWPLVWDMLFYQANPNFELGPNKDDTIAKKIDNSPEEVKRLIHTILTWKNLRNEPHDNICTVQDLSKLWQKHVVPCIVRAESIKLPTEEKQNLLEEAMKAYPELKRIPHLVNEIIQQLHKGYAKRYYKRS